MRQRRGSKVETEARPCEAEARPSQLKKLPRGRLEPRQMPRGLHPCAQLPCILHQHFTFEMIRFTGYGVIAEKLHDSHLPRIFPCTLQKKLCVVSKNDSHLFNGLDVHCQHAKFLIQRAVRSTGCIVHMIIAVYGSILMRFSIFSRRDCLSESLHSSHFRYQLAPQYLRNCGKKICEKSKNWQ